MIEDRSSGAASMAARVISASNFGAIATAMATVAATCSGRFIAINWETTAVTVCLVMAIVAEDEDPRAFPVELIEVAVMLAACPGEAMTAARVAAAMAAATKEGGIEGLPELADVPASWALRLMPDHGAMAKNPVSRKLFIRRMMIARDKGKKECMAGLAGDGEGGDRGNQHRAGFVTLDRGGKMIPQNAPPC